jgi:lactoylglutathione lyase
MLFNLTCVLFCLLTVAQPQQRPAIIGISHVTFQVSDLDKAVLFYEKLLGYSKTSNHSPEKRDQSVYFHINERQFIRLMPGLKATDEDCLIEIGFATTDVMALKNYLLAKRIQESKFFFKEPLMDFSFLVEDPDQHLIRFSQYPSPTKTVDQNLKNERISDRILHLGVQVRDTQKANQFYAGMLGFSEIWRGGRMDSITNWINMRVPEGTDYIEYMLVSGKTSRPQTGVNHHVALMVPDLQKSLDLLRKKALPQNVPIPTPIIGRNRRWLLNLFDPDGTRIELMEPFPVR